MFGRRESIGAAVDRNENSPTCVDLEEGRVRAGLGPSHLDLLGL